MNEGAGSPAGIEMAPNEDGCIGLWWGEAHISSKWGGSGECWRLSCSRCRRHPPRWHWRLQLQLLSSSSSSLVLATAAAAVVVSGHRPPRWRWRLQLQPLLSSSSSLVLATAAAVVVVIILLVGAGDCSYSRCRHRPPHWCWWLQLQPLSSSSSSLVLPLMSPWRLYSRKSRSIAEGEVVAPSIRPL